MNCVCTYQKVDTCKSTGGHTGSPGRTLEKWEVSWIGHCRGIWAGIVLGDKDEKVSGCWGITTEVLKEAGELTTEVSLCCTEHSQHAEEAVLLTENTPCTWMPQLWFVNLSTGSCLKSSEIFSSKQVVILNRLAVTVLQGPELPGEQFLSSALCSFLLLTAAALLPGRWAQQSHCLQFLLSCLQAPNY